MRKTLTINIAPELHKQLKKYAAEKGISITEILINLIKTLKE